MSAVRQEAGLLSQTNGEGKKSPTRLAAERAVLERRKDRDRAADDGFGAFRVNGRRSH